MPARISVSVEELSRLGSNKLTQSLSLSPAKPETPLNVTVIGLKFAFRIQWSKVDGASGYFIAIMDDNNLDAPKLIESVIGSESMDKTWFVGDVAITRQFSVQTFIDYSGGRIFSDYSAPVSATSKIDGGASDSAPTDPPSSPTPSAPESPETPEGTDGLPT